MAAPEPRSVRRMPNRLVVRRRRDRRFSNLVDAFKQCIVVHMSTPRDAYDALRMAQQELDWLVYRRLQASAPPPEVPPRDSQELSEEA